MDAAGDVGTGTSKANTAILHTGFDTEPGSLESRLLRRGSLLLTDYARQAGIPVERTGALLVAWTPEQEAALPGIADKARRNGVTDVRHRTSAELYQAEPHLGPGARAGLLIPGESIICPWTTTLAYATEAVQAGVRLLLRTQVLDVLPGPEQHEVRTSRGPLRCRWLINAAGLTGDRIDRLLGGDAFTITPRRGELIVFDKLARPLLSAILLPVPAARTKGVLVAPTVYGNVLLGPTAEDVAGPGRHGDHGGRAGRADGRGPPPHARAGGRRGHRYICRIARGHRAPRLPDPGGRAAAVRLRGRDPVHRPVRLAGHRRVPGRPARRGRAQADRPGDRRAAGDALPRPGWAAAVPGRGPDRRRPGVRAHRLPLRAGQPGRDPRRAGRPGAAGRPGRAAPPDPGGQRAVPGLLLRGRGVGADRRPACGAAPGRPPGWPAVGNVGRADRGGRARRAGRGDRAAPGRGRPGPGGRPRGGGGRRAAALPAHRVRAA